jgi:hypothetical protein
METKRLTLKILNKKDDTGHYNLMEIIDTNLKTDMEIESQTLDDTVSDSFIIKAVVPNLTIEALDDRTINIFYDKVR